MNLVAYGIILIFCHALAIETDNNSGEVYARQTQLEKFLEKLKSSLQNGDSELGIPVLDPFTADKLSIKLKQLNLIDLQAFLTNVTVNSLSSYNVSSADFSLFGLKANVDLIWSSIAASTNYSMNGQILAFNTYGNGEINAVLHDFRVQANVSFTLSGQYLKIKQLSVLVNLQTLDFNATGLYYDAETSELLSKTISNLIPLTLNETMVTNELNHILLPILNKFLSTKTLGDLLKIIGQ
ncbi:uncharacterized protein [Cardiocondyla obscurior]|uniref:uncharacterized protein n=1 Tax=Cardiocondyla obscurior TaxID=286306 RepID=UPI0039655B84